MPMLPGRGVCFGTSMFVADFYAIVAGGVPAKPLHNSPPGPLFKLRETLYVKG